MSWLDILPSSERQKIREKYKMSAHAYEKLREKVKGPEQLKEEMQRNELLAQLKFDLETEPSLRQALKAQIEKDLREKGVEVTLRNADVPSEVQNQILEGQFDVSIDTLSESEPDEIIIVPEGNVSEKVAVSSALSDAYLSQLKVDK